MLARLATALSLLAALSAAAPVHAADAESERREAFGRGRAAMSEERWRDAQTIFQKLWVERRSFDVALQLGLVELNLKKYRDAAEHLSFGIRNLPPKEPKTTEDRARKLLTLAEREVAAVEIYVDKSNVELRVDGVSIGRSPLDGDTYLDPGAHQIEAVIEGAAPLSQTVFGKAGERERIVFDTTKAPALAETEPAVSSAVAPASPAPSPVAEPPPAPHDQAPKAKKNLVPVYVASAAAVVALGAGASFIIVASNKDSDKDETLGTLPGNQPCATGTPYVAECARVEDLATEARTFRTAGYVAFGVGAVAAGTAVYFFTRANSSSTARTPPPRFLAAPVAGPRQIGAVLQGAF
ncbi:MAG TPA: hypothetical protein VGK41_09645 [Solirubrobacterales bacterium]